MSAVVVVWMGRKPAGPWRELMSDYRRRIERLTPFAEIQVRLAAGRETDPERARQAEAAVVRDHLQTRDVVVALDERGSHLATSELAALLQQERASGRRVVFVIGSDLGLATDLVASAAKTIALSRLTLPHALARLILLEQLYRACDLLAGGGYHRSS